MVKLLPRNGVVVVKSVRVTVGTGAARTGVTVRRVNMMKLKTSRPIDVIFVDSISRSEVNINKIPFINKNTVFKADQKSSQIKPV